MATTFYNRSSAVEDFLKTHRSRLDEDKSRVKARGHDSPSVGILPNDEGRDQTRNQKRVERRTEYQQYLHSKENHAPRKNPWSRPTSITDVRQQMQKEREQEIMFGSQRTSSEPVGSQRRGVVKVTEPDSVISGKQLPVKATIDDSEGGVGLGRIGYKKEESPEEKKQRQSKYRAELIEQMKSKNRGDDMAGRMGSVKLFHDDEEDVRQRLKPDREQRNNDKEHKATRKHRYKQPAYSDEEDEYEDVRFDHYRSRPSRYKEYPYYPRPPSHHGPFPPPQYHHNYAPPYYYPAPYPPMYPPPSLHMPHPPPNNSYYMQDMPNPYMSQRHQDPLDRRSPPRVRSPLQDYPLKSRYSPPLPNKERGWVGRDEGRSSGPKETNKAADFRAILDQQVKEKKEREEKEKERINKLYSKIEAEAKVYDPWGKPGGGAPLTDATGNLVAERGQLRKSFEETSPRMSEEDRKKLIQEKTRKELEEQIKENKEKQMREKYMRQREDELQEMKILQELKELNMKQRKEIEEERKKKQSEEESEEQANIVVQPLSAQELAVLRLKEELEKKRMKEEEERQRLEILADKMASDSRPSWKQRSSSPPIPTLRNKPSSQMAAYPPGYPSTVSAHPSTHVPTHPSTNIPIHPHTNLPAHPTNVHTHPHTNLPHASTNLPHPPANLPAHPTNVHTHPRPPLSTTHTPPPVDAPLGSPPIPTQRTANDPSSQVNPQPSDDGGDVLRYTSGVARPVYQRETSQQLMKNFSDLKAHIRNTMTTSATESTRLRNPVPKRNSLSSATLQQFNQLKHANQNEAKMKFLSEYPDPPRTNTALETQQEALLLHQRRDGRRMRGSESSFAEGRQRPPTGISNFTIATMEIDSLANRNEERARRLEAILNVNRDTQQQNPQTILNEFLRKQDRPCPNNN